MTTYTELLPETKSEKRAAFIWTPATDFDTESSTHAGTLTITTTRSFTVYDVSEFPCDHGRGFNLKKTAGGTDGTEPFYNCFVGSDDVGLCDCKGFTRYGRCKHLMALADLVRVKRI